MTTPHEQLAALSYKVFMSGHIFPSWVVPSGTGHHVALISGRSDDPRCPLEVALVVRAETLTPLLDADLLRLGEPEPIPEFVGRRGFRWEPGSAGCRLTVPARRHG